MDIYQKITDRILEQMNSGLIPWQKPWHGSWGGAISHSTGKPYSIINQMLIGREGEFLTFNDVKKANGKIKKGAKGYMVVFFKMYVSSEFVKGDDGKMVEKVKRIPVLRYYYVYHIDDCEGVKARVQKVVSPLKPIESAEKVIADYFGRESVTLSVETSDRACYSPSLDRVTIPKLEQYEVAEEYYSTAFHEMVHSTGHSSRLNREFGSHFGSEQYSKEELIAEIGSAFLCSESGLENEKCFHNSVGYIQGWAKMLKEDKRLILSAASKAEKAVKYILTGKCSPVLE